MELAKRALQATEVLEQHYFDWGEAGYLSQLVSGVPSYCGTEPTPEQERSAFGTMELYNADRWVQLVGENLCIVYSGVWTPGHKPGVPKVELRLILLWQQQDKDVLLLHTHCVKKDNEQELLLANLTKYIPGGAYQCAKDSHLSLLSVSAGFLSMFGYTREEITKDFQNQYMHMIYPGDRVARMESVHEQLKHSTDIELEYRVVQKDGPSLWVLEKGRLLDDGSGGQCFYSLLMDITKRKHQEEELRLSLERHQVIMDQTTDIIFEWDIVKDTLRFSTNWEKRFGYIPIQEQVSKKIPLSQNLHKDDTGIFVGLMRSMIAGDPYAESEFRLRNLQGRYMWCRIRATAQYNENHKPIQAVGVIIDIDEQKLQEQELLKQAQRDALTDLYNKTAIKSLVEQRMEKNRGKKMVHAMMIIDIDYFKAVNDTYGHLQGDNLLSDVAAVLKSQIRKSDLAGRIGGDEFLVYLSNLADADAVKRRTQDIFAALSILVPAKGAPPITCSIGVAITPSGQGDYFNLYQCADSALYERKNAGRRGVSIFEGCYDYGQHNPSAVSGEIVSQGSNVADEQLAQYVFRTLYNSTDIGGDLPTLLEIIGRAYDVSRAYIFETEEDVRRTSITFEWCNEEASSQLAALQHLSYIEDLGDYQSNFNENGIFLCENIAKLDPKLRGILAPQGICSMLQCAIRNEEGFWGGIGFDECRADRIWSSEKIVSFQLMANVLATFVTKLRQTQKITRLLAEK